jgi:peptidoglycan/LPS O-acetylase OafA/YrhL
MADVHRGRVAQLDILRGFAVLGVLGVHGPTTPGESGVLRPIDAFLHRFGWTGVDLFFVLSGYLIGGLILADIRGGQGLDVRRFLVRRALRIWPPYYAFVLYVLLVLASDVRVGPTGALSAMWPAFVHVQNFVPGPRDHLWSLAVEEHFYLLLPLLLWLATRNTRKRVRPESIAAVAPTFFLLAIGCPLLRMLVTLTAPGTPRLPTPLCLDALFAGVMLAYLRAYRPDLLAAVARQRWSLLLGFALLAPALLRWPLFLSTLGYTCVYVGYSILLVHFVHVTPGQGMIGRWMLSPSARLIAFVGLNSYSIYLWHRDAGWLAFARMQPLARAAHLPGELMWTLDTAAYVVGAIAGGVLMEWIIARPVQRLRARMFPTRPTLEPALA